MALWMLQLLLLSIFAGLIALSLSGAAASAAIDGEIKEIIDVDHDAAAFSSLLSSDESFNVEKFGAKGDGVTDDTKAFQTTWDKACSSSSSSTILVPKSKSYLLKPLIFSGPCKSQVTVEIEGTIVAPSSRSYWNWNSESQRIEYWIYFSKVQNLVVEGGGTLNGNGQEWWKNSCKSDKSQPCIDAPTALTFNSCNGLKVRNLRIRDSQQIHVTFKKCSKVQVAGLTVTAPESSPNTDGIHVSGSNNVVINNTVIGTGDDCVSIVSDSSKIMVQNLVCGPGHGISIGSLGKNGATARVSDITVDNATLKGTQNGVRIKTWQGGSGYAKKIKFQNIAMQDAENPIIIDQNYCDSKNPCHEQKSAVEVSNVVYENIKGTSASEYAIKLDCSSSIPCDQIVLKDIDLEGAKGKKAKGLCNNVDRLTKIGTVIPTCSSSEED